jgi:hypothetical protein
VLGIDDRYIAYCIDEAALYVWKKETDNKNPTKDFHSYMGRYSVKRK